MNKYWRLYTPHVFAQDDRPYPNEALTDICRQLLDEWELTPQQVANLAADIAGECAEMRRYRSKVA